MRINKLGVLAFVFVITAPVYFGACTKEQEATHQGKSRRTWLELASNENLEVRIAAIAALRALPSEENIPTLLSLLGDTRAEVQSAVISALVPYGSAVISPVISSRILEVPELGPSVSENEMAKVHNLRFVIRGIGTAVEDDLIEALGSFDSASSENSFHEPENGRLRVLSLLVDVAPETADRLGAKMTLREWALYELARQQIGFHKEDEEQLGSYDAELVLSGTSETERLAQLEKKKRALMIERLLTLAKENLKDFDEQQTVEGFVNDTLWFDSTLRTKTPP